MKVIRQALNKKKEKKYALRAKGCGGESGEPRKKIKDRQEVQKC